MKVAVLVFAVALVGAPQIFAQAPPACRVLCTPEFKVGADGNHQQCVRIAPHEDTR